MLLAIKNAHPRDAHITFDEGPHIYTVHGEQGYTSVTTWNHHHFKPFDSSKIIDNMLKSKKRDDPTYKYYGMTKEQIQEEWRINGDNASKAGTKMHNDIEYFYNGLEVKNESIEFEYFQRFRADFPELRPYRTEWMIYWEEMKISGSVDMVYENPDGTLLIYDWKRVKEIAHENKDFSHTPCISHLPNTNFWHYSLQLNMYKKIIEEKYGKKVVGLFLVVLHPENHNGSYLRFAVHDLSKEIEELMEVRKKELSGAGALPVDRH